MLRQEKKVTRGYNIVVDGWAGASNPHPNPKFQPNIQTYAKSFQQVTRGHNIVAEGWAGASNPHPNPIPHPPTHKHTQKVSKTLVFLLFNSIITNGPTDGPTDGRTDGRTDIASYRVAGPQLKTSPCWPIRCDVWIVEQMRYPSNQPTN